MVYNYVMEEKNGAQGGAPEGEDKGKKRLYTGVGWDAAVIIEEKTAKPGFSFKLPFFGRKKNDAPAPAAPAPAPAAKAAPTPDIKQDAPTISAPAEHPNLVAADELRRRSRDDKKKEPVKLSKGSVAGKALDAMPDQGLLGMAPKGFRERVQKDALPARPIEKQKPAAPSKPKEPRLAEAPAPAPALEHVPQRETAAEPARIDPGAGLLSLAGKDPAKALAPIVGSKRKIVAISAILVALSAALVGGAALIKMKPAPGTPTGDDADAPVATARWSDAELGVAFELPERWGEPRSTTHYSFTEAIKEFTFPGEPNVRIIALTPHYQEMDWLVENALFAGEDLELFCREFLAHKREQGDDTSTGEEDVFRRGGTYANGECGRASARLDVATKRAQGHDGGWMDADAPRQAKSTIDIYRSDFFALDGPVFTSLTVQVRLPAVESEGYCVRKSVLGEGGYRLLKNFSCMNYGERDDVGKALAKHASSQLERESRKIAETFESAPASGTDAAFRDRFERKTTHESVALGIRFDYPGIMPAPGYSSSTRELAFPGDAERGFVVKATTRQDAQSDAAAAAACDPNSPCLPEWVDAKLWDEELAIIKTQKTGGIACPRSGSLAGGYGLQCEVVSINGAKAIARYYAGHTTDGRVRKEYVFYTNGGKTRLDVLVGSDGAVTSELSTFMEYETTDFALRLANGIARSIVVTK